MLHSSILKVVITPDSGDFFFMSWNSGKYHHVLMSIEKLCHLIQVLCCFKIDKSSLTLLEYTHLHNIHTFSNQFILVMVTMDPRDIGCKAGIHPVCDSSPLQGTTHTHRTNFAQPVHRTWRKPTWKLGEYVNLYRWEPELRIKQGTAKILLDYPL